MDRCDLERAIGSKAEAERGRKMWEAWQYEAIDAAIWPQYDVKVKNNFVSSAGGEVMGADGRLMSGEC
jgi:hypothetical protein